MTLLRAIWLVPLLVLLASAPAHAVTYEVTTAGDGAPGACDADCTLREAVMASNVNSSADEIDLNNLTVTLTRLGPGENGASQGDLDVGFLGSGEESLHIFNGAVIGGPAWNDRIFHVESNDDLQLTNVSVRGGNATFNSSPNNGGGNMLILGDLAMTGGEVSGGLGHRGGGLELVGTDPITLDGVLFEGNIAGSNDGGAIWSSAPLQVEHSIFRGNNADGGRGGGIDTTSTGAFAVLHSHFEGNIADRGGGVAVAGSSVANSVSGSSFVGNTAVTGGGGVFASKAANLENVTFSGNEVTDPSGSGGGIYVEADPGQVNLAHATLTGNSAPLGPDVYVGNGTLNALNTLVVGTCRIADPATVAAVGSVSTSGSCGFTGASNRSDATVRLGPLTEVGVDQVYPLLGGSDAIDVGDPDSCSSEDQRGVMRTPLDCDAGAFEALKTDLSLALTATPEGPLRTGDEVTLTATVTNKGPRTTGGVMVTMPLPAGASFVSGSAGCTAGPPVVCQLGALEPDATTTATVVADTAAPGALAFPANTLGDLGEAAPGDEEATATVRVSGPDTRDPALRVALAPGQTRRKAARKRRLKVRVTTNEACTGAVEALRGSRRLKRVRGRDFGVGTATVNLKLSKGAARRVRGARRVKLRVTCADAAGNAATARRTAKLGR